MKKYKALKGGSIACTVISAVCFGLTVAFTIKSSFKAKDAINKKQEESDEPLTKKETVTTALPYYTQPLIFGSMTIASIVGSQMLGIKSQASFIAGYTFLDQTFRKYRKKVVERYGSEEDLEIKKEIMIEDAENVRIYAETIYDEIGLLENQDESERILFYDSMGRRFFTTTLAKVISAEYHLCRNFVLGEDPTLKEFYEFLGIAPLEDSDTVGWTWTNLNDDGVAWLDFSHVKAKIEGKDCIVIYSEYDPMPFEE